MGEVKTGGIRMILVDGKYRVWAKKIGGCPTKMLTQPDVCCSGGSG